VLESREPDAGDGKVLQLASFDNPHPLSGRGFVKQPLPRGVYLLIGHAGQVQPIGRRQVLKESSTL
jgi:hypothetical protein